jgi:hypothetical protein
MISYLINGSLIAAAGRVSNTVIRPELTSRSRSADLLRLKLTLAGYCFLSNAKIEKVKCRRTGPTEFGRGQGREELKSSMLSVI